MTHLQQLSLIAYMVRHPSNCDCNECQYFGGVGELFKIYTPQEFTEIKLRKIYGWLHSQFLKGSCHLEDLDFINDPTTPKLSDISECAEQSMVFENGKYLLLKDILCD